MAEGGKRSPRMSFRSILPLSTARTCPPARLPACSRGCQTRRSSRRRGRHLMSFTPGDEYISSCLRPLRRRNSMAAKSRLSILMFFSNSRLASSQRRQHARHSLHGLASPGHSK